MYNIIKEFDFCYGHRVWTQVLDPEFALTTCHACRRLHGHQGLIHICLEADELKNGMVTDFKNLAIFKKWLDDTLDHKFIMDKKDPAKELLFPILREGSAWEIGIEKYKQYSIGNTKYYIVNPEITYHEDFKDDTTVTEIYEGLVFVDFVPTSENLSRWLLDIIQEMLSPLGVIVSKVEFYETPKSRSIYIA